MAQKLNQREFDIAICAALRAAQMAQNGKNRIAIFTILRVRRIGVKPKSKMAMPFWTFKTLTLIFSSQKCSHNSMNWYES